MQPFCCKHMSGCIFHICFFKANNSPETQIFQRLGSGGAALSCVPPGAMVPELFGVVNYVKII